MDVFENQAVLSFVDNSGIPLFQPFYSNFGGIQILEWEKSITTSVKNPTIESRQLKLLPNPMVESVQIQLLAKENGEAILEIYSVTGRLIDYLPLQITQGENIISYPTTKLSLGTYFFKVKNKHFVFSGKGIKVNGN